MAINPMPSPIDYMGMQPQIDPGRALLQGLQVGSAIRGMRQQRQQEEEAARMKEQFSIDMQSYLANPTAAGSRELILKYPQMREVVAENWSSLSKEMQDEEFKFATNVSMALKSNNPEVAARLIEQRRDAFANAGMDTTSLDTMLETANTNPTALPVMANLYGASLNPEKWGKVMALTEEKKRYRILSPEEAQQKVPNYNPAFAYQETDNGEIKILAGAGGEEAGPDTVQSSEILPDGTRLITMRSGKTIVEDAAGNALTGEARAEAIKKGREYGIEITGRGAKERGIGTLDAETIGASFKTIEKIQANLSNLDAAIAAIDDGANTGVIAQKFPSWNASTIALKNVRNRLGLDVIGSVTFGALSEQELDLALETALPTNLNEAELRQWLVDKKTAQQKLSDYLTEQVVFLREGNNSVADWVEYINRNAAQPSGTAAEPTGGAPPIGTVQDGYQFLGGDPADSRNWEKL